jgi:predicted AAA+ superfamily ATPase
MHEIEISSGPTLVSFLCNLGKKLDENPSMANVKRYRKIPFRSSFVYVPAVSEFTWYEEIDEKAEEFQITLKEEGVPLQEYDSANAVFTINYYTRIIVRHVDIDILKTMVNRYWDKEDTDEKDLSQIRIYYSRTSNCSSWEYFSTPHVQKLEHIFIPQSVKSTITHRIDAFIESRERYIRFGRPHKLSFLLSGVPGSGKTSLVKSLALKYDRKLYVINFSKTLTDEKMIELMADIPDESILLFEDIDSFFVNRQPQDIHVSFSCLLNVLDGTMSQNNGSIIFMTANNPDRLEPALVRPGRIDAIVKFDMPHKTEIQEAFIAITELEENRFHEFYSVIRNKKLTMSAIIDYLFRYPSTYMDYLDELLSQNAMYNEIVNDKTNELYH